MSGGRDKIMAALQRSLRRGGDGAVPSEVRERLTGHPRGLIPKRAQIPGEEKLELFATMARELAASVARVEAAEQVPQAVAEFLKSENLPAQLRMAPDPELQALPWDQQSLLEITEGPARESDPISVTGALAGIAETGTLMLLSGAAGPTTLNFLPETHIVVLPADRVVAAYEDGWDLVRQAHGPGQMPRTVNFITGPSRTADIEQTIQLGAHGPRRLHIVLVGKAPDGAG